jgi:drug/metabolite transporter (DMT)-like permease
LCLEELDFNELGQSALELSSMENNLNTDPPISHAANKPPPTNWRKLILSLLINGFLPWLIYTLVKRYTHVSEMTALLATSVPSLLDALVGIVRNRRLDVLAGFILFTIAISVALVALGGNPKLYLVRESLVTGAFGVLALCSLFFPRPLTFYIIRYVGNGDDPERGAYFDAEWEDPTFQRDIRAITLIFGVLTVAETAIRVHLAFTWSISHFLAVSPLIFYGYGALMFVCFLLYKKRYP